MTIQEAAEKLWAEYKGHDVISPPIILDDGRVMTYNARLNVLIVRPRMSRPTRRVADVISHA